jgi:hypothetical protein
MGLMAEELGVQFMGEARNFSLLYNVHIGPGAYATSYTIGTGS